MNRNSEILTSLVISDATSKPCSVQVIYLRPTKFTNSAVRIITGLFSSNVLIYFTNRQIYTYIQHIRKCIKWTKSNMYIVKTLENIVVNIFIPNLPMSVYGQKSVDLSILKKKYVSTRTR